MILNSKYAKKDIIKTHTLHTKSWDKNARTNEVKIDKKKDWRCFENTQWQGTQMRTK